MIIMGFFSVGLTYKHLGESIDVGGGYMLDACGEVGLLSRNVVIRGDNNKQWNDTIEACGEGFNPGMLIPH